MGLFFAARWYIDMDANAAGRPPRRGRPGGCFVLTHWTA